MDTKQQKDDMLWQLARKRASFKWNIGGYFIVNAFLVAVWYFSSGIDSYFWPIWPMLGWGIGVALQYFHAYHGGDIFSVEEEYKKLKNQQDK